MKKFITFLLFYFSAYYIFAYDAKIDGIFYNLDKDTHTAEVTWGGQYYYEKTEEYADDINIPESINFEGQDFVVTSISDHAFYECENVTSIEIPPSVTFIGEDAFAYCILIENFTLPPNLISIEEGTFYQCRALKELVIPDKVTIIGQEAFARCVSLSTLTIGSSVEKIRKFVFDDCSKLSEIICKPIAPPTISFSDCTFPKHKCTLYVYEESLSRYKMSTNWYGFKEYLPIEDLMNYTITIINAPLSTLNLDEYYQLEVEIEPVDIENNKLIWNSSDDNIVTVDRNGLVHAVSEGSAIISVSLGEASASCEITVVNPIINPEQIILNLQEAELKIGETLQLAAIVLPEDTTAPTVIWGSSNENVAIVSDEGLVTAISEGEAIIAATCGEVLAECAITVPEVAGVENLFANPNSKISVYSLNGVLIKKDCKTEDLKSLDHGVYILKVGNHKFKIQLN